VSEVERDEWDEGRESVLVQIESSYIAIKVDLLARTNRSFATPNCEPRVRQLHAEWGAEGGKVLQWVPGSGGYERAPDGQWLYFVADPGRHFLLRAPRGSDYAPSASSIGKYLLYFSLLHRRCGRHHFLIADNVVLRHQQENGSSTVKIKWALHGSTVSMLCHIPLFTLTSLPLLRDGRWL